MITKPLSHWNSSISSCSTLVLWKLLPSSDLTTLSNNWAISKWKQQPSLQTKTLIINSFKECFRLLGGESTLLYTHIHSWNWTCGAAAGLDEDTPLLDQDYTLCCVKPPPTSPSELCNISSFVFTVRHRLKVIHYWIRILCGLCFFLFRTSVL